MGEIQFSSVQSCPTLCNSMDSSMSVFPVHHQPPELTQTDIQQVGDAIQPSHPLSSPSPPAFNLSQDQGSFPVSLFFASGGQSIGASSSTSILPMNVQVWLPLEWTCWISLQSKGLSRVFPNTTVQKHQFFGDQLSLRSTSHIHAWLLENISLTRWDHGGEFCLNLVHWRMERQATSLFLRWEPHQQYEKAERYGTERWTSQVSRFPKCYWRRVEK